MSTDDIQGRDISWILLEAMREAGYVDRRTGKPSQRALATELQARRPRSGGRTAAGIESWRQTIRQYTSGEANPKRPIAELLADVLNRPRDFFLVRPRGGGSYQEENRQLREDLAATTERLAAVEAELDELRRSQHENDG